MIKLSSTTNLWYGTEESLLAVASAVEQLYELQAQGEDSLKTAIRLRGGGSSEDPFQLPSLVETKDGVSVINVSGSLVNGTAGFMRLFGVLGYGDIADALLTAAASKDSKSIMLSIDSGGGAVNGVEDLGNLIQSVSKLKPVIAHTDGSMNSAAYWLGVSADKTFGTKTSQSGSVGTLIVHTEYSKMLADDGIKKTLVRHGQFKALGNPYEPLSEDGKAQLQSLADEAGKIFVDYAAGRRGVTAENFQKTMGEGRVFMGAQAHKVGLLDGVMNAADAISFAKTLDTKKLPTHNSRNSKDSHMKASLATQILLAIAGGAKLEALNLSAPEANAEGAKLEASALVALTAEASVLIKARDDAAAVVAAAHTASLSAAVLEATTPLKAELKAATDKITILESATTDLTGKLTASGELAAKSAEIVKASMSVMSVALGGAADVGAALTGNELLAQHATLKDQFTKKFPVGGVAAVNPGFRNKDAETVANTPPAEFLALLNRKQPA